MISKYFTGILKAVNGILDLAQSGVDYLSPTGDGSGLTGISTSDTVLVKTQADTPVTVTAAQCNGRTRFNNQGTTAIVEFDLPNATVGLVCHFDIVDADGIELDPNSGDALIVEGTDLGADVNLTCKTQGASLMLVCSVADKWNVVAINNVRSVTALLGIDKTTTSTSFVTTTLSITLIVGISGIAEIDLTSTAHTSGAAGIYYRLNMDSGTYIDLGANGYTAGSVEKSFRGFHTFTGLSPGSHTFLAEWRVTAGTAYCSAGTGGEYNRMVLNGRTR